ncbi:cation:proton antiporter [Candidatus Micrarchaeota archaeon]|nr:cation:proton antiporter [Candidatus Micrarchaeota archaeon]MBU2476070.1 cation:proton antiporter [Candidatus Micrarchaeota archaeon]
MLEQFAANLNFVLELGLVAELGLIVVFATLMALIGRFLKQPLILTYIVAGVIIGPIGLSLIGQTQHIALISELGVAFLLFTVGVESDLNKLKNIGKVVFLGSLVQVLLISLISFFLFNFLGLDFIVSVYLGLILAFSSTMVVIKNLSDTQKLNTLHGRLMIGFLLMQDFLVVLALPLISVNSFSVESVLPIIVKGILLVLLAFFLGKFVFSKIVSYSSKSQELLFLSGLSTCFVFIFLSSMLEFSPAVGAFLAGLSLSSLSSNLELIGKIRGIRDFFVTVFFVSLGMQLTLFFSSSIEFILLIAVLMLFIVLILKPVVFALISIVSGYGTRNGLLVGFSLAQISEFSFILASQGFNSGQGVLPADIFSITIIITALTMALTPYFMNSSESIYSRLSGFFSLFSSRIAFVNRLNDLERLPEESELNKHIVVVGAGVMGSSIAQAIGRHNDVIVVDHDPDVIFQQINLGINSVCGNIENNEVWSKVNLAKASLLVIAIPDVLPSLYLIDKARRINPEIAVFARAKTKKDALDFYERKVDFVILPDILGGNAFIKNITAFIETGKVIDISNFRDEFISYLKEETKEERKRFKL